MRGAPAHGPGDDPMWSPMSSTLIYGERDTVLVDTLVTFDQVDSLVNWIDRFENTSPRSTSRMVTPTTGSD